MPEETASIRLRASSDSIAVASTRLKTLSTSAGSATAATTLLGSAFAGLGIVGIAGALRGLKSFVNTTVEFERTMSRVQAVTGSTTAEMAQFTEVARDLGATTRYSASEAAEGLAFLGQAGFETTEILDAIPDVLNLATAGMLELGRASDIASNVLSGFGLRADETVRIVDVMALSAASANTTVEQLGEALSYAGPVAAAAGISIEDAAAAINILSNAGIQGSRAGTGLNRVLAALASPTDEVVRTLTEMGIAIEDVNPATVSLTEIARQFGEAGITMAEGLEIAGLRGGPALLVLAGAANDLEEMTLNLDNAAGAGEKMAEVMDENLAGDIKRLSSAWDEFKLSVGETGAIDAVTFAVIRLTDAVRGLTEHINGTTVSRIASGEALNAGQAHGQFASDILGLNTPENNARRFGRVRPAPLGENETAFGEFSDDIEAERAFQREALAADRRAAQQEAERIEREEARRERDRRISETTGADAESLFKSLADFQAEQEAEIERNQRTADAILEIDLGGNRARLEAQEQFEAERLRISQEADEAERLQIETAAKLHLQTRQNANTAIINSATDFTANLAALADEGTDIQRAAFFANRAIAVALIISNAHVQASEAGKQLGIFGIPLSAQILAAGYANAATVAGTAIQGYERGGLVPGGSYGIVGESGPELIRGPAVVTSARNTADLAGSTNGDTNVVVNITNQSGGKVTTNERQTPDGRVLDILVQQVDERIGQDIQRGQSRTFEAIQRVTGLQRNGR